jgi:steroid 5-alpha reductase family enzyme
LYGKEICVVKVENSALIGILFALVFAALIALAGSQRGQLVGRIPLYMIGFGIAFIIQWIAFIPSYLNQTEKFYDLTGGITYLTVTIVAVLLSSDSDMRSFLLLGLVAIWAIRLSSFLFRRIQKAGEDVRFAQLKTSFLRFLLTWTLQGLWVSLSLAAALAAITSNLRLPLGWIAGLGLLVWLVGFAIEVVADRQKSQFRTDPVNAGKFIQSGLWAWSRHPNYFGEIVLWIGIAIISLPVLRGWQWVTLISPVFIILLLTRISGVPMLETSADEKWGGQPNYEAYKANTPVLIPRPPTTSQ